MADSSSSDTSGARPRDASRSRATLVGLSAVLLWALLALFTIGSSPVPPLLLNALCFGIGGMVGVVWMAVSGTAHRLRQVPLAVYAFGTAGLFGYHILYFTAFRLSPTAETGLIAYLWPLLIVLGSALLPGERLRAAHVAGALLAFSGATLIILGKGSNGEASGLGQMLAFGCALTWAAYSLISRRLGAVPTESVAVFCIATAVLSALAHVMFEPTIWPKDLTGWVCVVLLGLGPVGIAFYTWDVGVKRGDVQLLGVASYAAPLLSTVALIVAGIAEASVTLLLAALLITGGAALAARAGKARQKISAPKGV
ncbi:EamA family transporter [Haematobacter massiliensis]|uniref:Membrane protein n=1 Tax=Haematobacter massiliensis TaxID=195105 RepID=A0A086Y7Y9_9RHOB|nr:EamA family transporter [Haematobacter massiliensis]KFI30389.1 membrane protein [Haematobacter massiliensis]OWJ70466.1 EamA family transporter [Haematobacter massiliensis]OWJ87394.1 EamA family transporter [Haematobacter massiliensis]QBJ24846.1 EamA family transporter [Haematobacter massiliensis]